MKFSSDSWLRSDPSGRLDLFRRMTQRKADPQDQNRMGQLTKLDSGNRASQCFLWGTGFIGEISLTITPDKSESMDKIDGSNGGLGLISEEMINTITVGEGNIFYHTTSEGRTNYVARKLIADHSGFLMVSCHAKGSLSIGVYEAVFLRRRSGGKYLQGSV